MIIRLFPVLTYHGNDEKVRFGHFDVIGHQPVEQLEPGDVEDVLADPTARDLRRGRGGLTQGLDHLVLQHDLGLVQPVSVATPQPELLHEVG